MNLSLNFILKSFLTVHIIKSIKGFVTESAISEAGDIYIRKILPVKTQLFNQLRNLANPNIPKIHFTAFDNNKTYIIEEYISGTSLETLHNTNNLSLNDAKTYFLVVCNIVSELHRNNIIHGNICAKNIIVQSDKNIKLIGFDAVRYNNTNDKYGLIYEKTCDYYSLINTICKFIHINRLNILKIKLANKISLPDLQELDSLLQIKKMIDRT